MMLRPISTFPFPHFPFPHFPFLFLDLPQNGYMLNDSLHESHDGGMCMECCGKIRYCDYCLTTPFTKKG